MRRRYPHRITIQRIVATRDTTTGEQINTWTDYAPNSPAHVLPISGRELIASNTEHSEIRARIEMRYRNDLDHTMRILFRGMIYNIHAILPDNDTGLRWITLMCTEGLNDG